MSSENDIFQIDTLKQNLGKIAYTLDKEYFSRLEHDYYVLPFDEYYNSADEINDFGEKRHIEINTYVSNIRALKIKRIVYDKEESFVDCMQNAVSIFSGSGNTLALVFNRFADCTDVYAVVRNDGQGKNEESKANIELLCDSLYGNFPGSELEIIKEKHGGEDTKKIFSYKNSSMEDKIKSIAAVCNIPSAKSEEYVSQNLEKLFNGIVPKTDNEWYSVVIFAESLTFDKIHMIREGLEELASDIFPFQQHQFQAGESEAETKGEMKSLSHSDTTSVAITKTHSVSVGINGSRTLGNSIVRNLGRVALGQFNGKGVGASLGYGYNWGKTTSKGEADTTTSGTNNSIMLGETKSTTYSFQSYTIKNMLERLEQTLERLRIGEAIGYWKYAAYVCSSSTKISKNVANYMRALFQGTQSFTEPSIIKEWHQENVNGSTDFEQVKKYLLNFSHPVFVNKVDGVPVNFAANVNTYELANAMALPRHSIQGVSVTNGVSFGREPHSISDIQLELDIGCGYHMYQKQVHQRIKVSKEELTKHTFITGSTGAGKSNTIYKLLSELGKRKVKFLVVEPAKGEYKKILGKREDVITYGTNPQIEDMELLRINPFKFPDSIHILEHMDRLVEIFNVCWPMYAAMPAILKDSIERAYVAAGWDLVSSKNRYDADLFPTFSDVVTQVKQVLKESDYSADNKGDYTGALVTRLNSLTNGINGLIFSANDIDDKALFDENVIVDLSRVGSVETKALFMGLLVLKLQEYRMDNPEPNSSLRHITVLEEAHNLLRRTSTEQVSEESNLLGKSVEMLANSIAEMRTYGEGFVIADQSPGLLDVSVIRNTNTKIIMRLPDISDRELVGKAAGLNDNQITELARLEQGVAAVVQSEWLEPVLCKIDKYEEEDFSNESVPAKRKQPISLDVQEPLLGSIMSHEIYRKTDRIDIKELKDNVIHSSLSANVKCDFMEYIFADDDCCVKYLRKMLYDFFDAEKAINASREYSDLKQWVNAVVEKLNPSVKGYSGEQIKLLLELILDEQAISDAEYINLRNRFNEVYGKERKVF